MRFTDRIELQSKQRHPDELGAAERWTTYAVVYGKLSPLSGREQLSAAQLEATFDHTLTIRWRTDLASDHRFIDSRGAVYHVTSTHVIDNRSRDLMVRATRQEEFAAEDYVRPAVDYVSPPSYLVDENFQYLVDENGAYIIV